MSSTVTYTESVPCSGRTAWLWQWAWTAARVGPSDSPLTSEIQASGTKLWTRKSSARHDLTLADSGGPENVDRDIDQSRERVGRVGPSESSWPRSSRIDEAVMQFGAFGAAKPSGMPGGAGYRHRATSHNGHRGRCHRSVGAPTRIKGIDFRTR